MKVIFLDIDGVLNSKKTIKKMLIQKKITVDSEVVIDEYMVNLLAIIVKVTNAKIVLSSSWRMFFDTRTLMPLNDYAIELNKILNKNGINIYSVTGRNGNRQDQIDEWLNNHNEVTNFAIIDDDSSPLMKYAKTNLVKTSNTEDGEMIMGYEKITGLTPRLTLKSIIMLNKKQ